MCMPDGSFDLLDAAEMLSVEAIIAGIERNEAKAVVFTDRKAHSTILVFYQKCACVSEYLHDDCPRWMVPSIPSWARRCSIAAQTTAGLMML